MGEEGITFFGLNKTADFLPEAIFFVNWLVLIGFQMYRIAYVLGCNWRFNQAVLIAILAKDGFFGDSASNIQ